MNIWHREEFEENGGREVEVEMEVEVDVEDPLLLIQNTT